MHLKTETQDTLKTRQGESKQVESKTSYFEHEISDYYPFKTNHSDIKTDILNLNFLNSKRENQNWSAIATYYWQGIRNS